MLCSTEPEAEAPDRSTSRRPSGLLGMLALVMAVEAGIAARRPDLVSPWVEGWRVAAQAAETKAPGSDVLCFGDSLIKYGVLPKVIEAGPGSGPTTWPPAEGRSRRPSSSSAGPSTPAPGRGRSSLTSPPSWTGTRAGRSC